MPSPSVYEQCGHAARQLIDDPSLRPITTGPENIFTELDVIMLAARFAAEDGHPFTEGDMAMASRQANEAMGRLWRNREVVRFGPVNIPGFPEPDYMRVASKMVYAGAGGVEAITTPNGTFPRFFIQDDPITRRGRRNGAIRDDLTPWLDQNLLVQESAPKQSTPAEREVLRLKVELSAAYGHVHELEVECDRLREINATLRESAVSIEQVEDLIASRLGDRTSSRDRAR